MSNAIRAGFFWASGSAVLLHQDAQGIYVERLLRKVLNLLARSGRAQ